MAEGWWLSDLAEVGVALPDQVPQLVPEPWFRRVRLYLAESVYTVVVQKSILAQIRQLILYHYSYEE